MRAPDFWQRPGLRAKLLSPLGILYGASVARKARTATPWRAPVPVICVGNLTAGGSGKTPVAITIAQVLAARGKKVFFLTRGYGGREKGPLLVAGHNAAQVGDEALLLAAHAPTIVARDRAAGARLAVAQGADVIVMDDGHQNFTLAKTLSLVVVDGQSGFGNRHVIPAGPLREPVAQGLARADAVIVMGSEEQSDEDQGNPNLGNFVRPVLRAQLAADGAAFQDRKVFAFAGIGRPEKFVASLRATGAICAGTRFFPDHHPYRGAEIAALRRDAGDALLITTEKDWVRLDSKMAEGIAVLKVSATFSDPRLLDSLLPPGLAPEG